MNKTQILIFTAFLVSFKMALAASNIDWNVNPPSYQGYVGDNVPIQIYIKNYNTRCNVNCDVYKDENILFSDIKLTEEADTTKTTSYTLRKYDSSLRIGVECEESEFLCFGTYSYNEKSISLTTYFCGDNEIYSKREECDGSNLGGKTCKSIKDSNYDGTLRCSNCKFDTSGCVKLGTDENCAFIGDRCASHEECFNRQCRPKCGNGRKDLGENCLTCYQDVPCEDGQDACSSGICIDLDSDENCGAIGTRCDTAPKTSSTGEKYCSSDYTRAIEVLKITTEACINKVCKKQEKHQNKETNCRLTNTYCQDGSCGCSEGYEICGPLKRCVKKKDVKLNQPCECDFQCEKGFCDYSSRLCAGGLNMQLSAEKSILNVGEETILSLSVSNPLNIDVDTDILLNLGNDVERVEVLSGDQCSGSQCKLDKTKIPVGGKKDVTVKIRANSGGLSLITANVIYGISGRKEPIEISDKITIKIIECGNGKVEEGETSETCCIDVGCSQDTEIYSFTCNKKTKSCTKSLHSYYLYGGVGALVLVSLIIFAISRVIKHRKKSSTEKDKEKKRAKKKEKKQEEKKEKKVKHKEKEEKQKVSKSIAKEIEHLHTLMETGILTKREFKKKKKQLLKGV